MEILNNVKSFLWGGLLLMPLGGQADVLVDVTATMVNPPCRIRSDNSSSPLKIGFGTLNIDKLSESITMKDFSLYISGCNFADSLVIVLSPKNGNTLLYNGKNVLATSIDGLGIDFKDVTGGTVRALEMNKNQPIYPEQIEETVYRLDLQAQLVNAVPIKQLELGKFTSTVTLTVTYN